MKKIDCIICNKRFDVYPYRIKTARYCSYRCYWVDLKQSKLLQREKHPNWKGGRTADKDGYIRIKFREHPFSDCTGYVREHRLVVEHTIGRYLSLEEEVHHINGDKQDNRYSNLMILSKREHSLLHQQLKKQIGL